MIDIKQIYGKGKSNIQIYLSNDFMQYLAEHHRELTGSDEALDNSRQFFQAIIEKALSRKDNKAPELQKEVKQLQEQLQEAEKIKVSFVKTKKEDVRSINHLKDQINLLIQKNEALQQTVSELTAKQLPENAILTLPNDFQKKWLNYYTKDIELCEFFSKLNDSGKMNGFCNRIDTDSKQNNLSNLLLNVFIFSAAGYRIINTKEKQIKQSFSEFLTLPKERKESINVE